MLFSVLLLSFFILFTCGQEQFVKLVHQEFNRVRAQQNPPLPAIPWAPNLAKVAQIHAEDLNKFRRVRRSQQCNLHTWYEVQGCCYTSDHSNPKCMWEKTKQLSRYPDIGFEIAYDSGPVPAKKNRAAAKAVVKAFIESQPHRAVILSRNAWRKNPWLALGVGNTGPFTTAWFGRVRDPATKLTPNPRMAISSFSKPGITLKFNPFFDKSKDTDFGPKDIIPDDDYLLPADYENVTLPHQSPVLKSK